MFSILFIVVWFTTFGADATGVPDCPPLVVPTSDGGVTFLGGEDGEEIDGFCVDMFLI